jgi:glycosyltransferase involved in cell wall biosynthesis
MKVVVILPCLNEEKSVGKIIKEIKKHNKNIVIIAINDASTDKTLKKIYLADKVINLKKRISLSHVIRIGLSNSLKEKADIIVHIDGDGQHDPSQLNRLLQPILRNKADIVIGSRFMSGNKMPFFLNIGNKYFTAIVNFITGLQLTDAQSGFRAIRSSVIRKIKIKSNYTYTQEEIIKASKLGFKIKEVSVFVKDRSYGKSKVTNNLLKYFILTHIDILRILLKN